MGSVWIASDPQLDRKVAVKLILHARNADAVARFMREARTAAKISNQHAVVVYECGEERIDGVSTPYIAMELLPGEDLKARLEWCHMLSLRDTARVISHVAKALAAAHKAGVIHRDIKIDNIVLVPDDEGEFIAKVLDFGIAKSFVDSQAITATGETVGTPQYMSPEQVRGDPRITPATDLWSLGVVAYRCLTGSFPFSAPTLYGLLSAILQGRFPPVSIVKPDSPPALDAWFQKALAKDPEQRFSSALQMAEAFSTILDESPPVHTVAAPLAIAPTAPARGTSEASAPMPAPLVPTATPRSASSAFHAVETQNVMGTAVTAGTATLGGERKRSPIVVLTAVTAGLALVGLLVLAGLKLVPTRRPLTEHASSATAVSETAAPTPPGAPAGAPPSVSADPTATVHPADAPARVGDAEPAATSTHPTATSRATATPASTMKPKPQPANRRPLGF